MSEWKEKVFEDVCVVDKECLPENTEPSYCFSYISLSDVEKGKILNSVQNIPFKDSPSRARRILHNYDVLMATVRPNLQAFAILGSAIKDMIASTGFAVLSEKDNNSTEYIYHYLYTDHATRQINNLVAGSNYPAINSSDVKRLKINIPTSLSEQRKIARILSTVDSVIEKTESAIAKYKAIKAGMMRDLFTRGIDVSTGRLRPSHEEAPELYKQSALGWVPKEWDVQRIGDLLKSNIIIEIQDGNHGEVYPRSSAFSPVGIPFLSAKHINEHGDIDWETTPKLPFSYLSKLRIGFGKPGDVLFAHNATVGPVGYIALNETEFIASTSTTIYRSDNKMIQDVFLFHLLQSHHFQREIERIMGQTTRNQVPITAQKLIKVPLPEYLEQNIIADRLESIRLIIRIETKNLRKIQMLKQALMSDLLTGKVRVKYEEENTEATK